MIGRDRTDAQWADTGRQRDGAPRARRQVGDVGDLAKLATAKEGVRPIPDADEKLAHELEKVRRQLHQQRQYREE